jgi:(p)ppGpp synthase/HD superfamily hydrolase
MKRKAKRLAKEAHKGQRRKFEGVPFFEHPKAVAAFLKSVVDPSEKAVAAALLHDTVEDTSVTLEDIESRFGKPVAGLVKELTTDKEKRDKFGKAEYLGYKMAGMSDTALTIKLCDRYHNVHKIDETPNDFRTRYSRETKKTLSILFENRNLTNTQRYIATKILEKVS